MIHIDRIIAYGCSHTAGQEIMDHVYLNMPFERCNEIKRNYLNNERSLYRMHNFINYYNIRGADNLNRQSSWAAQIAKKFNKTFENRAENGSGLDQIYFKIFNDLNSGLLYKNDLVIIGLPTITRIITFNHKNIESLILGWSLKTNNTHDKTLVELLTDDWLIFNYCKTLKLMIALNDKINIRFQPMTVESDIRTYNSAKRVENYNKETWHDIEHLILSSDDYLRLLDGHRPCGFGHWPIESHIEFADRIYEKIYKNYD